ncbi:MAG: HTH-type transcriptional regulator CysB [Pseudomonadales bacterium]
MKLQQLRYIVEVSRQGLNISSAAEKLHTSQPGISKQIRLLEDELGVEIFTRSGKHLTHVTQAGEMILREAEEILRRANSLRQIAQEFNDPSCGSLSIATTHTQARYALPAVINDFIRQYPNIAMHIHQGTPMQIAQMVAEGQVDMAIATEAMEQFPELITLPCYRWNRCVLVPKNHPLCAESSLSLAAIAQYPIVTYVSGFTGRSKQDAAFLRENLVPQVVFTATDADVIKTYVRLGLGIGIIAHMAFDTAVDSDLVALDASHLFEPSVTRLGIRRGTFIRSYMYDFIAHFAPHLDKARVVAASQQTTAEERAALFFDVNLPVR